MSKCRIVYKPDKSVVVIHYAPKSSLSYEEAMNKAMQGELTGLPYEDIEDTALPSREFRDAWEGEKGKDIEINEVKKQAIIAEKSKQPTLEERVKKLEEKVK